VRCWARTIPPRSVLPLECLNLQIPPLRERREDIPLLAVRFLELLSRASGITHALSDDTMNALLAYDWPGNVRELENCIERCCAMNSEPVIHMADRYYQFPLDDFVNFFRVKVLMDRRARVELVM
jgi:DNA-binding NtrC family response regulator